MGTMITIPRPYEIGFAEDAEMPLKPGEVRLKMLYSGISAGTQLTLYRGKNPYINKRFNRELRLFEDNPSDDTPYPIPGAWAYEEVGEVAEIGPDVIGVCLGDVIYGTWGHRTAQTVTAEYCRTHTLSPELPPVAGIYSQMGAIAMNAILDSDIHLGETVAVFGQGVPGQIVTQLAILNGAEVIAVDRNDFRLGYSKKHGAALTLNPDCCDTAMEIKSWTEGRGADKVIEISGFPSALHAAIRACAYHGKVICSGFMTGEANGLVLGEEFHHNRIQLICSQIENVGLHVQNTWDRLRMEKTVFELCRKKKIDLLSFITHRFPYEHAAEAYALLERSTDCLQTVLEF